MKTTRFLVVALVCLLPLQATARDLVVFAAASLKEPLDQIAAAFGDVVVSYGGSGVLARQIRLGAPADVVVLAHPLWMTVLEEADAIADRTELARNSLVLIAPKHGDVALNASGINAALGEGRLAMGLQAAVPAGIYGKAALEHLNLWDTVSGQLAEVENVRAALALVARGEAPLGIVYATDARVSPDVHVVATFPPESHPSIRYEFARVKSSDHARLDDFMDMLAGDTAQGVFAQAGFLPRAAAQ